MIINNRKIYIDQGKSKTLLLVQKRENILYHIYKTNSLDHRYWYQLYVIGNLEF